MIYADYDFYYDTYRGSATADEFERLAIRASSFLEYYTQGRVKDTPELEAVKMACCALVDQYKLIEAAQALAQKNVAAGLLAEAGELQSESVGSYSRSFRGGGDSSLAALKTAEEARCGLADVAREYLLHTGVLYRGRCF